MASKTNEEDQFNLFQDFASKTSEPSRKAKAKPKSDAKTSKKVARDEIRKQIGDRGYTLAAATHSVFFPVTNGKPLGNGKFMPCTWRSKNAVWMQGKDIDFSHHSKGADQFGCTAVMLESEHAVILALVRIHRQRNPDYRYDESKYENITVITTISELASFYYMRHPSELGGKDLEAVTRIINRLQTYNIYKIELNDSGQTTGKRHIIQPLLIEQKFDDTSSDRVRYFATISHGYMGAIWTLDDKDTISPGSLMDLHSSIARALYPMIQKFARGFTADIPYRQFLINLLDDRHARSLPDCQAKFLRSRVWRIFAGRDEAKQDGVASELSGKLIFDGYKNGRETYSILRVKLEKVKGRETETKKDSLVCWTEPVKVDLSDLTDEVDKNISKTEILWRTYGGSRSFFMAAQDKVLSSPTNEILSEVTQSLCDEVGVFGGSSPLRTASTVALLVLIVGDEAVVRELVKLKREQTKQKLTNPGGLLYWRLTDPASARNAMKVAAGLRPEPK